MMIVIRSVASTPTRVAHAGVGGGATFSAAAGRVLGPQCVSRCQPVQRDDKRARGP